MLESELSNVDFHDTFESLFQTGTDPLSVHLQSCNEEFAERTVTEACATSVSNTNKTTEENANTEIENVGDYECVICGKIFAKPKQYHGHLRIHSKDKPWMCSTCGESFTKKSQVARHKRVTHLNTFDPRFFCSAPQCNRFFVSSSLLQYHERRMHNSGRSHICKVCGIGFFKRSYLKEHSVIHEDLKYHPCKTCGKSFTNITSLQTHERSHSVGIHKCDQCSKTFNQETLLKTHKHEKHANGAEETRRSRVSRRSFLGSKPRHYERSTSKRNIKQPQDAFSTDQLKNAELGEGEFSVQDDKAHTLFTEADTAENCIAIEKEVIEEIFTSLENCPQMKYLDNAPDKTESSFDSCRFFDDDEISIETEKIIEELDITIKSKGAGEAIRKEIAHDLNCEKNDSGIPPTPYGMTNFESLATLAVENIDNNEYFNVDDLNPSSFNVGDITPELIGDKQNDADNVQMMYSTDTGTNCIFFHHELINFLESTDVIQDSASETQSLIANTTTDTKEERNDKETTVSFDKNDNKKAVKKHSRRKNNRDVTGKSLLNNNCNFNRNSRNNSKSLNNILNIKSVVTDDKAVEEVVIPKHIDNVQKEPPDTDNLSENPQNLVDKQEVVHLQLFATDDVDTFVISINSDLEASTIQRLIKDGVLTIDINEEDEEAEGADKDIDNQLISAEFLDTTTCDTIFKNVEQLFDDTISLAGDDCQPLSQKMSNDCQIMSPDCQIVSPDCEIVSDDCGAISQDCQPMSQASQTSSNDCQIISPDCRIESPDCQIISDDYKVISQDCQKRAQESRLMSPDCQVISPDCQVMSPDCQIISYDSQTVMEDSRAVSRVSQTPERQIIALDSQTMTHDFNFNNLTEVDIKALNDPGVKCDNQKDDSKKNKTVNRRVYVCRICDKIFNKKDNFQSHMGSHDGGPKRHKCEDCNQKFSWRTTLTRHKSAKHGPRTTCPYCSASYTTSSQVQQHIHQVHLQKKKHMCNFPDCGQAFFKSSYLKIHRRTHTNERPYNCELCGVSFSFSSHRLRHERIHYTPPPLHGQRILRCNQLDLTKNIVTSQWNIKSH